MPGPDGSRRQRTKGGFTTKHDAQTFLTQQLASLTSATYAEPSKLTLGQYLLDYWLPTVRSTTRPSTWDAYRRAVEQHIVPALGGVSVQRLTPHQLDRFYADKLQGGRLDGTSGLSVKSVRNLHALLHKALRDAERKQLVSRNVATSADPPKQAHRTIDRAQTWTPDEFRVFLNAVRPHRLYAAFLLAATTGMRRGEILGLRWCDVDFEQRRAAVRQTIISVAYEVQLSSPKTAKGRRSLAVDDANIGCSDSASPRAGA